MQKSPSAMLAYGRRITRLVYLVIAVMVIIALMVGFFGAYTKTKGDASVIRDRRMVGRSIRATQGRENALVGEKSAAIETIDDLVGKIEKPDLYEALQLAQKGLGEPRVAYSKMDYRQVNFLLVHDGPVDKNTMDYFRAFVGVHQCS